MNPLPLPGSGYVLCVKRTSVTVLIPLFLFSFTIHTLPWQHPPSLSTTANPRHPSAGLALTASPFLTHGHEAVLMIGSVLFYRIPIVKNLHVSAQTVNANRRTQPGQTDEKNRISSRLRNRSGLWILLTFRLRTQRRFYSPGGRCCRPAAGWKPGPHRRSDP